VVSRRALARGSGRWQQRASRPPIGSTAPRVTRTVVESTCGAFSHDNRFEGGRIAGPDTKIK
jgi:hypothetical protein